jgi:hypothetical protein
MHNCMQSENGAGVEHVSKDLVCSVEQSVFWSHNTAAIHCSQGKRKGKLVLLPFQLAVLIGKTQQQQQHMANSVPPSDLDGVLLARSSATCSRRGGHAALLFCRF